MSKLPTIRTESIYPLPRNNTKQFNVSKLGCITFKAKQLKCHILLYNNYSPFFGDPWERSLQTILCFRLDFAEAEK